MIVFGRLFFPILLALLSKAHQETLSNDAPLKRSWAAHASQASFDLPETSCMFIIAHYRARPPDSHSTPDSTLIYLATIVLLHDIETNPGPIAMPPGSMLLSDVR